MTNQFLIIIVIFEMLYNTDYTLGLPCLDNKIFDKLSLLHQMATEGSLTDEKSVIDK